MSIRTVYQTLENRNNSDEVLNHGPYDCTKANAWLHSGYYFWEEFIDPAHYWGVKWNRNRYIITKGQCLILEEDLFDLVGNMHHIKEFKETYEYMLNELKIVDDNTTVAHVIDYLKREEVFDYIASRANTTEAFRNNYKIFDLKFSTAHSTSLIMNPAVQICIYDLERAYFDNFEIIFKTVNSLSA